MTDMPEFDPNAVRVALALERIATAAEELVQRFTPEPPPTGTAPGKAFTEEETLQARATYNRDNAQELFGDVLTLVHDSETSAHWTETATGKSVVFTPYGWRVEEDVKEFMQ